MVFSVLINNHALHLQKILFNKYFHIKDALYADCCLNFEPINS